MVLSSQSVSFDHPLFDLLLACECVFARQRLIKGKGES